MTTFRPFDEQGNMIRTGRTGCGKTGVVSAGRAEASRIGRDILAQGGNAIDAAVAVAFAMGVCEPNANGIGGGGFMMIRDGKTGKSVFLDFRENAPAAASPAMYTPKEPGSNFDVNLGNVYGGKSVAVPGEVAGLLYALEHYGTMTPKQVISPAADLAREGFVVTPLLHADMEEHAPQLKQYGDGWKIYLQDGEAYPVGSILCNSDLANTLDQIAEGGKDAFYKGEIADRIIAQVQKDGGVLMRNNLQLSILSIPGAWDVAIEMNSTSKGHSMAGWRVGAVVGRSEWLSDILRFKSNMDSGMFYPVQAAAAEALSLGMEWFDELNKTYYEREAEGYALLDALGCKYEKGQAGLFVWAAMPEDFDGDCFAFSDKVLDECDVFVTPGGIFGSEGNKYIRISLCMPKERLAEAAERARTRFQK